MKKMMRGMILLIMIMYLISPIDAFPGAVIDDFIFIFIGMMIRESLDTETA